AFLGLSGGIDSALVAVLLAQALGPEKVHAITMPSQYSSAHSLRDAEELARRLKIQFSVLPIKFAFSVLSQQLAASQGGLSSLALENLQSRLRGVFLMTMANHFQGLVVTAGNKSELAMGYCTLY